MNLRYIYKRGYDPRKKKLSLFYFKCNLKLCPNISSYIQIFGLWCNSFFYIYMTGSVSCSHFQVVFMSI